VMDLAYGICWLPVHPLGSNRTCANLSTRNLIGTPYCRLKLTAVAKASIRPEIVEPSLAMVMKISPGAQSTYKPNGMYPACGQIENLWVMERRSSDSLRRTGRKTTFSTVAGAGAAAFSDLPADELSGCTCLEG